MEAVFAYRTDLILLFLFLSGGVCYLWEVCENSPTRFCPNGVSAEWDAGADVQYHTTGFCSGLNPPGTRHTMTRWMFIVLGFPRVLKKFSLIEFKAVKVWNILNGITKSHNQWILHIYAERVLMIDCWWFMNYEQCLHYGVFRALTALVSGIPKLLGTERFHWPQLCWEIVLYD